MADYVIVGAGSAGCVLANRLSADPAVSVVLLEAGGRDNSLLYRMPGGYLPLMQKGIGNWAYETVPQKHCNNRAMYFPRGKVLGGSSAINGLVASRGNAGDYDHWAQLGNAGWSYADVLPYFRKMERYRAGEDSYRGGTGPMGVNLAPSPEQMPPISKAWLQACIQAGHKFTADCNGAEPEGVAQMQTNIFKGLRQSASASYLKPILGRRNLKIITGALATRIILASGRATGVEVRRSGRTEFLAADTDVILSGGAINSPQLLQLSGIGNPEDILPHGIAVQHELPGVGRNLIDHPAIGVRQLITKPYSALSALKPLAMAKSLAEFLLRRTGNASGMGVDAWAHLKSRIGLEYPDLQIYCVQLMYEDHGRKILQQEGFMNYFCELRPQSVGTIKIRSADPAAAPAIDPNFLAEPEDVRVLRDGIKLCRDIIAQPALDELRGTEYSPGAAVTSDAELDAYIRANALTIYHPVGSCKMGRDPMAVVDPATLEVHGLSGLRVVDASVMPYIISGNTNLPTMMIAEKAADLITKAGARQSKLVSAA